MAFLYLSLLGFIKSKVSPSLSLPVFKCTYQVDARFQPDSTTICESYWWDYFNLSSSVLALREPNKGAWCGVQYIPHPVFSTPEMRKKLRGNFQHHESGYPLRFDTSVHMVRVLSSWWNRDSGLKFLKRWTEKIW